jgi:rhodanese-related sulfurtransferase
LTSFKKFVLVYLIILVVGVAVAFFYLQTTQGRFHYGDVSVEEARELIQQNVKLKIVDVRLDTEFNESHIPGAINVCVCDPDNLLRDLSPNDEILVYCRNGLRSSAALDFLNEHGYSRVYDMVGGIVAWKNAGYPTIEG